MITLGLIFLLVAVLTGSAVCWSVGSILLIVGCVLWLLGALGRTVGGRRHYF